MRASIPGCATLCDETGTLLMIDETHTFSAGPGGATRAWDLPSGHRHHRQGHRRGHPHRGLRAQRAAGHALLDRIGDDDADIVDVGGVGGTLAGNALSMAAARATLEHVLTDDAFASMTVLADRLADHVQRSITDHGLPWSVSRLGARSEYRFCAPAPTNGTSSAAAEDVELNEYLHLCMSNRWRPHHPLPQHDPDLP